MSYEKSHSARHLNVIGVKLFQNVCCFQSRLGLCGSDETYSLEIVILTLKQLPLFWTGSVKGSEGRACAAVLFMYP
jgi:hypothetical protein